MARNWTREELLLALKLYHQTPFGKQHKQHKPIIRLAQAIGRTPSSVAMKLCNFTSLDPVEIARGVKGLKGSSKKDREVWHEFQGKLEALIDATPEEPRDQKLPTEQLRTVKARRYQDYFRAMVLGAYNNQCCIYKDHKVKSLGIYTH